MQGSEMAWIALSCVLALSVNLCTYGLIGKTSAVTYQVVGHAKVEQQPPSSPAHLTVPSRSPSIHPPAPSVH